MDILIVSRGLPTDRYPMNGIFEFDQAQALKSIGHKIVFFAVDLRSARRIRKKIVGITHEIKNDVDCYVVSFPIGRVPNQVKKFIGKILINYLYKMVFKDKKPDIIHAHFAFYGEISSFISNRYNIPLVITEHSSMLAEDSASIMVKNSAMRTYKKADQVIAVSEYLANVIYDFSSIMPIVISNMVDLDSFDNISKKPHDVFTFVAIGNLIPRKGYVELFKAFKIACQKIDNIRLEVVGSGQLENELKNLAIELNIYDKVNFNGRVDRKNMYAILEKSDCFVLSSKLETFGVVYIEAMAAGLPIIATKCGGPNRIINNSNGLLIEKDDIPKLAEAILYMYENIERYNPTEIRNYAINNFSPKIIAGKLISVYENVIAEREKQ